jgi:hypothetical protein
MREIERDGNAGNTIWGKPLFGQPHVRLKPDAAPIQFTVEAFDVRLEKRSFNLERKIANSQVEQMLV